jgi:hypothetical protein
VEGNRLWNRTYGGSDDDHGSSVIQTSEGSLVLTGHTQSFGTSTDIYLAKTTARDETPPITSHDYDGLPHENELTVNLVAIDDWVGVDETYYRINDGPLMSVGEEGQPLVATAGLENKLEYWSVDINGNEENHRILTDIQLKRPASILPAIITFTLVTCLALIGLWMSRRR